MSDEDEDRYCETIEAVMRDESLTVDERVNRIVISLQTRYLSRCIYQCPDCGKLFVDDNDSGFHVDYDLASGGELTDMILQMEFLYEGEGLRAVLLDFHVM